MSRLTHLFIHELVHKRKSRVSNGRGGFTETLETIATIQGRVTPSRKREADVGSKKKARLTHLVYLEPGSDIRINDEIYFGDRRFRALVISVIPSIAVYYQVLVEEVQSG